MAHDLTGSANDNTFSYTYTNAHQTNTAAASNSVWLWQPTANSATSYTPDNLNQYTAIGSQTTGGTDCQGHTQGLSYDCNGNLTFDGTNTYTYDAENRLLTASHTGVAATYAYDPLGRRIKKSGTGVTPTWFLDDGTDEVGEYIDNAGTKVLTRRIIPGPAIDEPIAIVDITPTARTTTYFHADRQGSVVAMSDANGNLAEGPHSYDPYGNCFDGSTPCGTSGQPYRYTGRRFDPETGLYYYRARYYDPAKGRFLQTDPVGYVDDLNLYTYAANDPPDRADPDGEDSVVCNMGDNKVSGCVVTRDDNPNTVVTFNFTDTWTDYRGDQHTEHSSVTDTYQGRITDQPNLFERITGTGSQNDILGFIANDLGVFTGQKGHLVADSSDSVDVAKTIAQAAASSGGRAPMRSGKAPNTRENVSARDAVREAERNTGQKMTRDQQRAFTTEFQSKACRITTWCRRPRKF